MERRTFLKAVAGGGVAGLLPAAAGAAPATGPSPAPATGAAAGGPVERDGIQFWVESSLKRVYPTSPPGGRTLARAAARNQRLSFQACFRNGKQNAVRVRCDVKTDLVGADPAAAVGGVRVRRVGFVPLRNLNTYVPADELEGVGYVPGLCPDPLFPEPTALVGPHANGVFWVNLTVPPDAAPGPHAVRVTMTLEDEFSYVDWVKPEPWSVELTVAVDVRPLVLKPRADFPVTQWLSADSIWEYYKIEPCGERFWLLAERYLADLVGHGVNVAYTPMFNIRHELLPRPAQLLTVRRTGPDAYEFDFAQVRRWVRAARAAGAEHVEWPHFFTPAPTSAKHPQRVFAGGGGVPVGPLLWPAEEPATGPTYRRFLEQFLPQFKRFLEEEQVLDRSLFHCADEPDGEAQMADYRKGRALLAELAPWMKVMDAMSDPHFATDRLSDMPVPSVATAHAFAAAGCPAWVYFCCGPRERFLQRLLDTPLPKIRMAGWLFYKLGAKGFLHWGHNYWFKFCTGTVADPFDDASVGAWPGLPAGDPFVVYPGPDGPLDSVRWEVFAESLQDYALLQSAGVRPDDPLLADIKDYREFPKSEAWLEAAVGRILDRAVGDHR